MSVFKERWISVLEDSDVEFVTGDGADEDTSGFEASKEKKLGEESIGEGKDNDDVDTGLLTSAVVLELSKDLFEGIMTDGEIDNGDRGADDELNTGDEGVETDIENVGEGKILPGWLLLVAASGWSTFPGWLVATGTANEEDNEKFSFFPASIDGTVAVKGLSFTLSCFGSVPLANEFSISFGFFSNDGVCVGTKEMDGF